MGPPALGPPDESLSVYFLARDEQAWDWRFIDGYPSPMRMIVLFDATSGTVRSTMIQPELSTSADSPTPRKSALAGWRSRGETRRLAFVPLRPMAVRPSAATRDPSANRPLNLSRSPEQSFNRCL